MEKYEQFIERWAYNSAYLMNDHILKLLTSTKDDKHSDDTLPPHIGFFKDFGEIQREATKMTKKQLGYD